MGVLDLARRLRNVFLEDQNVTQQVLHSGGYTGAHQGSRRRLTNVHYEKTIIAALYNRLAMDIASVPIRHVEVDEKGWFKREIYSSLTNCLTFEPNIDQAPTSLRQDVALTMFDSGSAALVPIVYQVDDESGDLTDVEQIRVGEVMQWFPEHVRVRVYNDVTGNREDVTVRKRDVAIVENPMYSVMNEQNSTLQRLLRKLSLLDAVDEATNSGKLDIIIQLPYVVKGQQKQQQAENRREVIEAQLTGSKYGIAYIDGTEKVTQLNRPAENNLMAQVEYLTALLYSQLGITQEVMDGRADEAMMLNYQNRTVKPFVVAICEAMQRAFIGLGRTRQGEKVMYFRDPFGLVPVGQLAEVADKFARNEILTANEIRSAMGVIPSDDPKANKLINSNMPADKQVLAETPET